MHYKQYKENINQIKIIPVFWLKKKVYFFIIIFF